MNEEIEELKSQLAQLQLLQYRTLQTTRILLAQSLVNGGFIKAIIANQGGSPAEINDQYAHALKIELEHEQRRLNEIVQELKYPPSDDADFWDRPQPDFE